MAKTNVLFVDDERVIVDVYVEILDQDRYTSIGVESVAQAQQVMRERPVDVIVSDMYMPDQSGMDLLQFTKAHFPEVRFVMNTGQASISLAIESMKSGAFDFITKPVNGSQIRAVADKCRRDIELSRENVALKSDNSRLKEINAIKEKFIAITSHELRTPLTIIRGYADLLIASLASDHHGGISEMVCQIKETVGDLEALTARMHDMSGLTSGKTPYIKEMFSLKDTLEKLTRQFRMLAENKAIAIKLNCEHEGLVYGDPKQVKAALREVLINALQYTPRGGQVSIALNRFEDQIVVQVRDTGVGIPEDSLPRVFDMFYEAQDVLHHSTSEGLVGSSLGVGLFLVKEISRINQFEVRIRNRRDEGTVFMFVFPLPPNIS